jgi:ribosomal protein S18 acetylase RimI-like enzyme
MTRVQSYRLRLVEPAESALVFSFLTLAARMEESGEPIQKALSDAYLVKYWQAWGRPGDLGVTAIREADGLPISCAWLRRFSAQEAGETFVDERTAELAFGSVASERGRGVGTRVLTRLIELAAPDYAGISLSVRADNPAVRLYERLGFVRTSELTNRVGTKSLTMLLRF